MKTSMRRLVAGSVTTLLAASGALVTGAVAQASAPGPEGKLTIAPGTAPTNTPMTGTTTKVCTNGTTTYLAASIFGAGLPSGGVGILGNTPQPAGSSYSLAFPSVNDIASTAGVAVSSLTGDYVIKVYCRSQFGANGSDTFEGSIAINSAPASSGNYAFEPYVTATTVTLTGNPDNSTHRAFGTAVNLDAAIAPAGTAGTVQFKDGSANVGSPVTVGAVTPDHATITTSSLSSGSHSFTAVFTPSDTSSFSGNTSNALPYTIDSAAADSTSTTGSVNPVHAPVYTSVALHSDVADTASPAAYPTPPTGTVQFLENTTVLATATVTNGAANASYTFTTQGAHVLHAHFVPNPTSSYNSSDSANFTFTADAPLGDPQNIDTDVNPGTITITTPYNGGAVGSTCAAGVTTNCGGSLHLPTLALDPTGSYLSTSATFANIKVTDIRSGNPGWDASAIATDLTNQGTVPAGQDGTINGQNVGLTNITATTSGSAQVVTTTSSYSAGGTTGPAGTPVNAGASGSLGLGGTAKVFAHAAAGHGTGTATMSGTLTLVAPTTVSAGHYTGIVTFTVA